MHSKTRFYLTRSLIVTIPFILIAAITSSCLLFSDHSGSRHDSLTHVRTLAGLGREFGEPFGITVRGNDIFVSDGERGTISRVTLGGSIELLVSGLHTPSAIAFASNGDLIVADTGSNTIKRIGADRKVSIVAGIEGKRGFADGDTSTAMFDGPIGIAIGANDRIYVADTYNDRIRVIKDGRVTSLAGGLQGFADGMGASASFDTPLGIAIFNGALLVADSGNRRIRVVEENGLTWTLAGRDGAELKDGPLGTASFVSPTAVTVSNGEIFIADGNTVRVVGRRVFPVLETLSNDRRGLIDGRSRQARFNRPSGLAVLGDGKLVVADSDNQLIRIVSDVADIATEITPEQKRALRYSSDEFRTLQPARWPFDPPLAKREIAGTLGEVRGEVSDRNTPAWFHNGLDIAGSYGETARFVRSEAVLEPSTVQNFGSTRELVRLPTMGYIHIRIGRDQSGRPIGDDRFQFRRDVNGEIIGVRVPRGSYFDSGEPIGTLNSLNHVHLIAGRSGAEMNALDALILPGVSDSVSPTIENVSIFAENWQPNETGSSAKRIQITGKIRIVARAYDQVDGNSGRRRLGLYRAKFTVIDEGGKTVMDPGWMIKFDRMPAGEAVDLAYSKGSKSGPTGETVFSYIVTNKVGGDEFAESYLDTGQLSVGAYTIRIIAGDFFGNSSSKDINVEVTR